MTTDEKLDLILNKMDSKFEAIDSKFDSIDKRFDAIDKRFEAIDNRFDAMDKRFDAMDRELSDVKSDVTGIKLQIENEIVPSIKRVAEGHQDLQRRLEQVVTYRSEYETLVLRVNHLETEVEKIQKKIS